MGVNYTTVAGMSPSDLDQQLQDAQRSGDWELEDAIEHELRIRAGTKPPTPDDDEPEKV